MDTIEQSRCRERTEEEDRAVKACSLIRALITMGVRELTSGKPPSDSGTKSV